MSPEPRRQRGRPRVLKPKRPVTVRLDDDIYDFYCKASFDSLEHVSTIVRRILTSHALRTRRTEFP